MNFSILQRNGGALVVVLAAVGTVVACSGGEKKADRPAAVSTRPCPTPPDSILGLATLRFMKTISPKPHRYLIPVGTDLALPLGAQWALQSTSATLNMWPPDTVQQKKVRNQLGKGGYTMLLVNYHGRRTVPDGRTAFDYSGRYMGGGVEGKAVPKTTILFSCHEKGERFVVDSAAPPA